MHSISLDVTLSDSERKIHMVGLRHDLLIYIITTRIRQKDLIYKDHKPLKMCRIQGINHGLGTSRNIKGFFLLKIRYHTLKGMHLDPDPASESLGIRIRFFSESLDKG